MSKQRNRDTKIWGDPWFRKLPAEMKLFWEYICDNANDAGVWKIDMDLAEFQVGAKLDLDKAVELFNETAKPENERKERVTKFRPGYLLLREFISFHYGTLTPTNNFHRKVIGLVEFYGIQGLISPSSGSKDKDTDKGKEKVGGLWGEGQNGEEAGTGTTGEPDSGKKESFGESGTVKLALTEHAKLVAKFGEAGTRERIFKLENYVRSKGKNYKSHYHTILSWEGRDSEKALATIPGATSNQSRNLNQLRDFAK